MPFYTVSTIQDSIPILMAGRIFSDADIAEACRKAVLELTEDYEFQDLQHDGPIVNLTQNVPNYYTNYFVRPLNPNVGDQGMNVTKITNLFLYYNNYSALSQTTNSNAGYNLGYSSVADMELLINTLGVPTKWTRRNGQIWLGMCPNFAYPIKARYQIEHPFPNQGQPDAGDDPILLPNSWQDIVEYATAMRLANNTRMFDIASQMRTSIYGDPKFQLTGGTEGTPGLIFHRTSQRERDQTTGTKSLRLKMYPYVR